MEKTIQVLTKKKLLIALATLAIMSGTVIASIPNVAGDVTSSIYAILKSVQTTTQSIFTIVQSTQTIVQSFDSDLNKTMDDLETQMDNLQAQVLDSSPNSLIIDKLIVLDPNGGQILGLLPRVANRTYSGHVTLTFDPINGGNPVLDLVAFLPETNVYVGTADGAERLINADFACLSLEAVIVNPQSATQTVSVQAVIQYQNSTNVSILP